MLRRFWGDDDALEVMDYGLGNVRVGKRADVPLQVANPQHKLRQGGGSLVDLDPE